jgi:hypothetical protein
MGEGHNHHFYPASTQRDLLVEVDTTYYCLKLMEWLGLVWDVEACLSTCEQEKQTGDDRITAHRDGKLAGPPLTPNPIPPVPAPPWPVRPVPLESAGFGHR